MFDGYAGPGWVWLIDRNTYNVIYGACMKGLKVADPEYVAPSETLPRPPMGG